MPGVPADDRGSDERPERAPKRNQKEELTMAVVRVEVTASEFIGLSSDTKPTDCGKGSKFYEKDTGKLFMFDGVWTEVL